jgi:hypothetical protein
MYFPMANDSVIRWTTSSYGAFARGVSRIAIHVRI